MVQATLTGQKGNAPAAPTVTLGQYLLDCLKKEGITEILGIPGDYNFSLLDLLEKSPPQGIRFVNARNELGAGYAADGYARLKGMSALITTFGVGEMSACNAVAGAFSEFVPLVHIVGAPKAADESAHKLMHHSLLDGNFDPFQKMYAHICAYTAVLTPENAQLEIPAALRMAKRTRRPVYLKVAIDLVEKPLLQHAPPPEQPVKTNMQSLKVAVQHIRHLLDGAKQAVLLTDILALRYGWGREAEQLAEALNIPAASLLLGKGGFNEQHPNYVGVYGGAFGSKQVTELVESAEWVIAIGLLWTDNNAANYTAKLDKQRLIDIQPESVRIGEALYGQVLAADLIHALATAGWRSAAAMPKAAFPYDADTGAPEEPLSAASYYPRFQRMLKPEDVLVVETGTLAYGMSQVRLPAGADYVCQQGWESIGYATGAAFGACIAAPDRRVLLFTGDGSLQLTVQEISSMLANGCRPVIFILNNYGYTIERYLNVKTENQQYNLIPNWQYTRLAEVFGGQAYTVQVRTNGELDAALQTVAQEQTRQLCIVELIVNDPMDAPDNMRKLRSFLQEQEKLMKQ